MMMLVVMALALIVTISGQDVDDTVKYEGIGCYNDNMSRPLPVLLKNFRKTIDWENEWPSFERVIRECANLAHSNGYMYFGIQFYGECWTGAEAYKTFDIEGKSTRCVHGVGKEFTNFVYMITQGREECSKDVYKTLSEPGRSISVASPSKFECDDKLMSKPGWFRFMGTAGNTLALKPPKTTYCTTLSGGWMVGSLPKNKSAPVSREVCFPYVPYPGTDNNACYNEWSGISIRVRNCGHFFVYELKKPPNCPLRYCGDTISIKDY